MAKLFEYEAKRIFSENGIPTPKGVFVKKAADLKDVQTDFKEMAIKVQVLTGGRGKSGGVAFADNQESLLKVGEELINKEIKGRQPQGLLIEEKIDIEKEYYAGIIIDDAYKAPVLIFSTEGGINVEQNSQSQEEKNVRLPVNVIEGIKEYQIRNFVRKIEKDSELIIKISSVIHKLYQIFRKYDALEAEINPLVLTRDRKILAVDARIEIDDAAVSRHPELNLIPFDRDKKMERSELACYEITSKDYRGTWNHIQMIPEAELKASKNKYIGYLPVGGGESMLSMDALTQAGLNIANYADTSGSPPASKVYRAAKIILLQPNIVGFYFITCIANQRLDITARGLIKAINEVKPEYPVFIRIAGNMDEKAQELIKKFAGNWPSQLHLFGREVDENYCANRMAEIVNDYIANREDA